VVVQLLLQHSNADMRLGPLNWFLAIAPVHRRHHTREFSSFGVNFGLFTNLWDHMLGVADVAPRAPIGQDDLGLADPAYPKTYLAQLGQPFAREPEPEPKEAREAAR